MISKEKDSEGEDNLVGKLWLEKVVMKQWYTNGMLFH